jgi:hypothetical protein
MRRLKLLVVAGLTVLDVAGAKSTSMADGFLETGIVQRSRTVRSKRQVPQNLPPTILVQNSRPRKPLQDK